MIVPACGADTTRGGACGRIREACPMRFTSSNSITSAITRSCSRERWCACMAIGRCGIEAVVPVPLHSSRRRKRGFNQAELLARELGRRMQIPVYARAVFRIRNTRPQKQLDGRERQENLKGAFAVSKRWNCPKSVLLVDDIYTTGSTIHRIAGLLKKAGVQKVYFMTISIGQDK